MKWVMLIILCLSGPAWAGEARPLADDPAAEARLKHLAVELRCLVCQIKPWPTRTPTGGRPSEVER